MIRVFVILTALALAGCARNGLGGYSSPFEHADDAPVRCVEMANVISCRTVR